MKRTVKKIYAGIGVLIETVVSIISVLLFSSFRGNKTFKAQRAMREDSDCCYILGNGASLTDYLKTHKHNQRNVFVVNYFGSLPQFRELKPDNYIVLDNVLIGRDRKNQNLDIVNKLYDCFQSIDWPMTFYYPSNGDMSIVQKIQNNNNISIVKYNMTPVSGIKCIRNWIYKKSLGMPLPQNISNAAIFCALNSGYKKIYLYGVEHSWMKSFDVDPVTHRIYMNDGHFYQKDNIRFFNRGDYKDWLLFIYKAMKSHFMLREYADDIGAKIVNKTANSFIEAYEFEEY